MMLSTAYLLLTLPGIFYSTVFYSKFNIPILKLADISDLLIAGISDPTAIVMFCGDIELDIFADCFFGFSNHHYHKWKVKPLGFKRTFMPMVLHAPKNRIAVVVEILTFFVAYYSYLSVYLPNGDVIKLNVEKKT